MEPNRPAAERVRPILEAMERSIDAARQRRLHTNQVQLDDDPMLEIAPVEPDPPVIGDHPAPRLKARPKRTSPFPGFGEGPGFHSQAG